MIASSLLSIDFGWYIGRKTIKKAVSILRNYYQTVIT